MKDQQNSNNEILVDLPHTNLNKKYLLLIVLVSIIVILLILSVFIFFNKEDVGAFKECKTYKSKEDKFICIQNDAISFIMTKCKPLVL